MVPLLISSLWSRSDPGKLSFINGFGKSRR